MIEVLGFVGWSDCSSVQVFVNLEHLCLFEAGLSHKAWHLQNLCDLGRKESPVSGNHLKPAIDGFDYQWFDYANLLK
jgi:hypothetical protein